MVLVARVHPTDGPARNINLDMQPIVKKPIHWPAIVKSVGHNVQGLVAVDPGCWAWEDPILIQDLGENVLVLTQRDDSEDKAWQNGNDLYEIELLEFPGDPIFMEGRFLKASGDIDIPYQYHLGLDGLDWEDRVELKHLDGTEDVALVFGKYVKSVNEAIAHRPH
ncbi:hypothetical protein HDU81_008149 [Chytriomyces hyalinus]|nr:hypothetical protein HDU81_008149 [Chytriomyces hyalinus]